VRSITLGVNTVVSLPKMARLQGMNVPASASSGIHSWQQMSPPSILPSSCASGSDLLAAGFEALDLLRVGVMVCGRSGELLATNDTAREVLQTRDGLDLDSEGVLRAMCASDDSPADLIKEVFRSSRDGAADRLDGFFAVQRPSGKRALTVFVRPLDTTGDNATTEEAAAVVMILDPALQVGGAELDLRQPYGLTAAEAQLANLLMEGMALEDCCDELGIRRTTASMHLRNLLAKTGVRRQGELVALLDESIGLGLD